MKWGKVKNIDTVKEQHHSLYGQSWAYGYDQWLYLSPYLTKDTRFLDVGCGALRTGIHVAPNVGEYVGIDSSYPAIKAAEEYEIPFNKLENENITLFVSGNFCRDTIFNPFDIILCSSVLQHLTPGALKQANSMIETNSHPETLIFVNTKLPEATREAFTLIKEEKFTGKLVGNNTTWYVLKKKR